MSHNEKLTIQIPKQYFRVALVAIVASALMVAGISTVRPTAASDDNAAIKVDSILTFSFTTYTPPGNIIADGHIIRHRVSSATYSGTGLNGPSSSEQIALSEAPLGGVGTKAWTRNLAHCTGCVDGHTGTLFIWSEFDKVVTVAPGVVEFEGTWKVITGTGDLEGASGGGKAKGTTVPFAQTHFKGEIHFGNDD